MFGKLFEIGSLMKQAQQFGGKVQEMISCKIDPALFQKGDVELLEDLIVGATNEAVEESRRQQMESMRSLSEGMDLGALGDTLGKMIQ